MCDDQEGTLLKRTRVLLQERSESYLKIYGATGLNPNWLSALKKGNLPNPSVNKVQALYEYLTDKPLSV